MNQAISIPHTDTTIGGNDVFIIAEIGKNFIQTKEDRSVAEYLENAKKLVSAAVEAGCDAVKFQTHNVEDEQACIDITSPHFSGVDRYNWVTRNTEGTPRKEFWEPLKAYCEKEGIIFFSTPMSRGAAQKIEDLVPLWKVGSGDVQDYVLIDYLVETGKPIIISTGMISIDELEKILQDYQSAQASFVVLYCISKYPCPKEDFNLSSIEYLREKYPNVPIGFSDHSIGDEAALAAVKLGAQVVEKHFSFSRNFWGADHKVSMIPEEMGELVRKVRNREYEKVDALPFCGEKTKEFEGAHNQFRPYFNKTLAAGCDISAGDLIEKEMIYAMRPRKLLDGLSANEFHTIVGRRAKRDITKYQPITPDDIT